MTFGFDVLKNESPRLKSHFIRTTWLFKLGSYWQNYDFSRKVTL